MNIQENPARNRCKGFVRTCLGMCAVDLREAWSPALINYRSMQLSKRQTGGRPILSRDEPPLVLVDERPVPRNMKNLARCSEEVPIHARACQM